MFDSFSTITRAWLGSVRISEETEFSVLNRKCGIDLAGERFQAGLNQVPLLLLELALRSACCSRS